MLFKIPTVMRLCMVLSVLGCFSLAACSARFGDRNDNNVPEVSEIEVGNDEPIECPRQDQQRGVC